MAMNPIWLSILHSSQEALNEFVRDVKDNVSVIPFVGAFGTEDENGTYNDAEFHQFLVRFARQNAQENIKVVSK